MNLISTLVLCESAPAQDPHIQIEESAEVEQYLRQIMGEGGPELKGTYSGLERLMVQLAKEKGPKGFQKLQDKIFQYISSYSFQQIECNCEHAVILNLTYFKKVFQPYLCPVKKLTLLALFAAASIHIFLRQSNPKSLPSVQDKIVECQALAPRGIYAHIVELLLAVYTHLVGEYKQAKNILANLISKAVTIKDEDNAGQLREQIMAVCTFYSYKNFACLGNEELASYYLTKSYELGRSIGERGEKYSEKVMELGQFRCSRAVKLTRIENKLQTASRTRSSWHSKTRSKIYSQKKIAQKGAVDDELRNILTIKDTKATMYKFKKDNMRYLNKEEIKLTLDIKNKEEELKDLIKIRKQLENQEQLEGIGQKIKQITDEKIDIKSEYLELKEKHFKQLKQVKAINKYFKGLFATKKYEKQHYIYNFLHGQMISKAKVFILGLCIKKKLQKIKKTHKYYKVSYGNLLHFVQIFEILPNNTSENSFIGKKNPGYYIKIFPLEKKKGFTPIEDQQKVDLETFQRLKQEPFYYMFEQKGRQLISWNQFISQKSILVMYYVRKLFQRLAKRSKARNAQIKYQKIHIGLIFQGEISIHSTLFACFTRLPSQYPHTATEPSKYNCHVFTISCSKYTNSIYNLKIDKNLQLSSPSLSQQQATSLLRSQFIKSFQSHSACVIRIQRFLKQSFCKLSAQKLKARAKISVYVIGQDVFSICKYPVGKTYIVVENVGNGDREMVETAMNVVDMREIQLIRDKLVKERTCKDKIRLICKFIWTKYFMSKFKTHIKGESKLTEFQANFKNRIIFCKMFTNFMYNRKIYNGKIAFTLVVESLLAFPRPYVFRVFTVDPDEVVVDIKRVIFNRDKLYYQKNVGSLNRIINICSKKQFENIMQRDQSQARSRRSTRNSRISVIARPSLLHHDDQFREMAAGSNLASNLSSKKSSLLIRYKCRKSGEIASTHLTKKNRNRFNNDITEDNDSSEESVI